MPADKEVLLIVEGAKTEKKLMGRLFEAYDITNANKVFEYKANIYDLYRRMFQNASDLEDLDLIQVLKEKESDPKMRALLDRNYSDVILIFDFDPQDHLYSPTKIGEMVEYFNESTDHGKLYINYPMVEAYRDITSIPYDSTFLLRTVSMTTLRNKHYKRDVHNRSRVPQLASCNASLFDQLICQNVEKACSLLGYTYHAEGPLRHYDKLLQADILRVQCTMLQDKDCLSVLCTCIWFVVDYNPAFA